MARIGLLARLVVTASLYPIAAARFWTATQIYVLNQVASPSGCDESGATNQPCTTTRLGYPLLATHTTQPPDATPITTSTETDNGWDLEVLEVYYPAGALPPSELEADSFDYYYTHTVEGTTKWLVNLTYTAPTTCPTPLEYTTAINLEEFGRLPRELTTILGPKASAEEPTIVTSTRTIWAYSADNYVALTETSYYTSATLHVQPTDIAPAPIEALRDSYAWGIEYYLKQCYLPGERIRGSKIVHIRLSDAAAKSKKGPPS